MTRWEIKHYQDMNESSYFLIAAIYVQPSKMTVSIFIMKTHLNSCQRKPSIKFYPNDPSFFLNDFSKLSLFSKFCKSTKPLSIVILIVEFVFPQNFPKFGCFSTWKNGIIWTAMTVIFFIFSIRTFWKSKYLDPCSDLYFPWLR